MLRSEVDNHLLGYEVSQPTIQKHFRDYLLCFFRLFIPCIFYTYCNKVTNGCNCLFCVFISFLYPTCFGLS